MYFSEVILTLRAVTDSDNAILEHLPEGASLLKLRLSQYASIVLSSPYSHMITKTNQSSLFVYLNSYPLTTDSFPLLNDIQTLWRQFLIPQEPLTSHQYTLQTPLCILFLHFDMSLVETIDASFTDITQLTSQAQLTQESLQKIQESLRSDSRCSFQSPIKTPSKRSKQIRPENLESSGGMNLESISAIEVLRGSEYRGQAFDSFLLFEKDDLLFLIDQHAAHERINLDSYLQQLAEDPHLVIQTTAVKKKECKLTATQCQTAWRLKELLEYWGYHISINGIKQLQIETVPSIDGFATTKDDFVEYINNIIDIQPKQAEYRLYPPPGIRRLLAQRACKNAVKFNTPLDDDTALSIGKGLFQCQLPLVCAHGRPTVMKITLPQNSGIIPTPRKRKSY
ncbi:hypothetical protein WA171_000996 [Blastocystis sp. BT1]